MKILMLTDQLALGGAETHIATLVRGLCQRGHTVEIASAGGHYAEKLAHEGFRHHMLPLKEKQLSSLFTARKKLALLLKHGGYDIVHAHARVPAFLATPICRKQHIPLVTTAHWVFRADGLRRKMSRWGDHTLAVSRDIGRYLFDNYDLPRTRITLTQNGIDTSVFYPRKALHTANGRLIHVSRLDKGRAATAAALIRLAPQLARAGCSRLTIVGDGDLFSLLKQEAEEINRRLKADLIQMTGGRTDIAPLLRESDLFIGVSRAALEAMACGLPTILAGDEGYLSLVTEDNVAQAEESNFCCRDTMPLKEDALLRDLVSILSNEERQQQLGQWAASYIFTHHHAGSMISDALHAYSAAKKRCLPPVIICGYYGFENMGDETVLTVLRRRLRRAGYRNITILSAHPKKTKKRHHTAAAGRLAIRQIRRAGKAGGMLLLGGGNLLQNETSNRSLLYYTQIMQLARRFGCRVYLFGGIGKLDTRGEAVTRRALRLADRCFARTPNDVTRFNRLGSKAVLLPDYALWTKPAKHLASSLPNEPFMLLALRGERAGSQGQAAIIDACTTVAQKEGLRLVFACLHPSQDIQAARFGLSRSPYARMLPTLEAEELVALLQRHARLVIATRLHALLFAAVAGTPAITFADGGKISDFSAFAAMYDRQDAPLLSCLSETDGLQQAMRQVLHTAHDDGQCYRYLNALRTAGSDTRPRGEDISFLWQNKPYSE